MATLPPQPMLTCLPDAQRQPRHPAHAHLPPRCPPRPAARYPNNVVLRLLTPKDTCRTLEIYPVHLGQDAISVNVSGEWPPPAG